VPEMWLSADVAFVFETASFKGGSFLSTLTHRPNWGSSCG
jgi:hypothetical protein